MKSKREKQAIKLLSAGAIILLVFVSFSIFLINTESEKRPSTIGIYLKEGETPRKTVMPDTDDSVTFTLILRNYQEEDTEDRYVLLYAFPETWVGPTEHWDLEFKGPVVGGRPLEKGIDFLDPTGNISDFNPSGKFYKYLVKGDGTSTEITVEITHFYTSEEDNNDKIRWHIYGIDYQVDAEPSLFGRYPYVEIRDDLTRFYTKLLDQPDKHNVTYLLEDPTHIPDLNYFHELKLEVYVRFQNYAPYLRPHATVMNIVPGKTHYLNVTVRNDGNQPDGIKVDYQITPTTPGWTIEAQEPYTLGDYIQLNSGESENITLLILASPQQVPARNYTLTLTAESQHDIYRTYSEDVKLVVLSLYKPEVEVNPDMSSDEVQSGREGRFRFTARNAGQIVDTFTLEFAVVQEVGTRAEVTVVTHVDAMEKGWNYSFVDATTEEVYEDRKVTLDPGEAREIDLLLTPPPGFTKIEEYIVRISVISGGPAREKVTGDDLPFTVTLPDLYITSDDITISPPEIEEDKEVIIEATVHLSGAIDTPILVRFSYSTTGGFSLIEEKEVDFGGEAGVDVQKVAKITWKAKVPYAVTDNIKVTVDADGRVPESNENNNEATATIKVTPKEEEKPVFPWIPVIVGIIVIAIIGILALAYLGFLPFLIPREKGLSVVEFTTTPETPKVGETVELKTVLLNEGEALKAGEHEVLVSFFEEFEPIDEINVSDIDFETDTETELPPVKWTPSQSGDRPITVVVEVDGEEVDEYSITVTVEES